ncbi:hypothetical protein Bca4012_083988 [Brassica carinata]
MVVYIDILNELKAITTSGTSKGDLFVGYIATQVKNKNFTADMKVASDSSILTTFTYDEATHGLKAIVSAKVSDQKSSKWSSSICKPHAGICTSIGLTVNPVVNFSGVIGTVSWLLVPMCPLTLNLATSNISILHALDPLTTVKAHVNNAAIANALIQHEWCPKSFITISGEVDSRAIEKSAKVGFAIALKP